MPTGNLQYSQVENDYDFFHVTCHIDGTLKEKIEWGEFVDLDRLLLKERSGYRNHDDTKLELIAKDGVVYITPSNERTSRISGLRHWKQAFHVYTAVYSKANPHRASEIWQYLHVINLAAGSYVWDNVAFYDYTFRQLMSSKLIRSWAKTYTQGWNLAMTELLTKSSNASAGNSQQRFAGKQGGAKKDWRDYCCWKFNKNKCDHSSSCDWDHRCTYCGGWYHRFLSCRTRLRRDDRWDRSKSPQHKRWSSPRRGGNSSKK